MKKSIFIKKAGIVLVQIGIHISILTPSRSLGAKTRPGKEKILQKQAKESKAGETAAKSTKEITEKGTKDKKKEERCGPAFEKIDKTGLSQSDLKYFTESSKEGFFLCQLKPEWVKQKQCLGTDWKLNSYGQLVEYECELKEGISLGTGLFPEGTCAAPYVKKKERREKNKSSMICFLPEKDFPVCQGKALRGTPVVLQKGENAFIQEEEIHHAYVCYFP